MNTKPKFQLPIFEPDGASKNARASQSRLGDLLEQTKLSRLPKLSPRVPCANCDGRLNPEIEYQMTVKLCGECLRNYANIGAILDAHSDRKIKRNFQERR